MYLAKMQWGQGFVTNNLPSEFKNINIGNSSSIVNYPYLSIGLQGTPEYYSFALKNSNSQGLSIEQINLLLSFDYLLGQTTFQLYFIKLFTHEYRFLQRMFNLTSVELNAMSDYLRYMIDQYFFNGLMKTKTVNEILWADNEPLLYTQLTLNPLLGGDPATNLNQTSIAQNMTQDNFDNMPDSFRDGMDSGETDVNNVRTYRLYGGQPYINLPTLTYFGEGPNGSNISYANMNPWAAEIPMDGTDAWAFRPYISKSDDIKFFFDVAGIVFDALYVKEVTIREFDCLRYSINPNILQNASQNPANVVFYQFGPYGIVNQTTVFSAPLFGSKPYFLDADPMLNQLVNYSDPTLAVPSLYESAFDSEIYSGTVLHALEQIQYNFEVKPDNLYPKLGMQSLNKYGYTTFMPMFFLQRSETLSQSIVDKYFGMIHTVLTVILVAQIVGYVLFGIFFILLVVYIWKKHRKQKINGLSEKGQSLIIGKN